MVKRISFEEVKKSFIDRGYVLLENEYVNNHTKMRYKCSKHPEEELTVIYSNFKRGHGCKHCGFESMAKKYRLNIEDVRSEFKKRGYQLLDEIYVNNLTPMRYSCPKHPDKNTFISYANLRKGKGCPYCAGVMRLSYEEVKTFFKQRGYELLEQNYTNNITPMRYKCPRHPDKELRITYGNLMKGKGCSYCAGNHKLSYSDVKRAFENRGLELLESHYKNATELMKFKCPKHPDKELFISYTHLKAGRGCSYCSKKGKPSYQEVKKAFNLRGYELIEEHYKNGQTLMRYKCPHHPNANLKMRYFNLKAGNGCPHCSESKGEKRIREWLTLNGFEYVCQYGFKDLKGIGGKPLRFDFSVIQNGNLSCLIEFDGEFHYQNLYQGDGHEIIKEHDRRKNVYCKMRDINLIRIPYTKSKDIESILESELNNIANTIHTKKV